MSKRSQPHLFAIPKAHCEVVDTWHVSGLKGTGSKDIKAEASFTYADCGVHLINSVAPDGALAVLVIAAPILGDAEAAIQRFKERLSTQVTAVHATRLVLERAANAIDIALEASAEPDAQTQIRIVRDAAWDAQPCRQAVNTAFSIRGGSASLIDEPLQRSWRDVNAGANHARLNWEDFTKMWGSYRIRQYAT